MAWWSWWWCWWWLDDHDDVDGGYDSDDDVGYDSDDDDDDGYDDDGYDSDDDDTDDDTDGDDDVAYMTHCLPCWFNNNESLVLSSIIHIYIMDW